MKKMYFLTAMFQNQFGKAMKYYDDKGWHWMLASDKPKLFSDVESAKKESDELSKDIVSEITIKEISLYSDLWEHKLDKENIDSFNGIFDERIEGKYRFVISTIKQGEEAKKIEGLYRINKEGNIWIFGSTPEIIQSSDLSAESLISLSYQKLQEAKALMQIYDYEKGDISKIEGVILFVSRLLKDKKNIENIDDGEMLDSAEKLINHAHALLLTAKNVMIHNTYDKSELTKLDGVILFVKKLIK